jgi:hypothetical protein
MNLNLIDNWTDKLNSRPTTSSLDGYSDYEKSPRHSSRTLERAAIPSGLAARTKPQAPRMLHHAIMRLYGLGQSATGALYRKAPTFDLSDSCD